MVVPVIAADGHNGWDSHDSGSRPHNHNSIAGSRIGANCCLLGGVVVWLPMVVAGKVAQ